MAKTDVRAGGAFVSVGAEYKNLKRALRRVQRQMKQFARSMLSIGKTLAAAGAASAAPIAMAVKSFANFGDQVQKTALRLGASTEALSEYTHVAQRSGVRTETLIMAWQRMIRRVSEAAQGTGKAKDAIKELGLDAKKLARLAPEDQFEAIARAMEGVKNQGDKVRLAMRLFDSEGVSLVQIMANGADGIQKLRKEARDLGISMDREAADGAARLKDNLQALKSALQGLKNAIGTELAPILTELLQRITGVIMGVREFVQAHPGMVSAVARIAAGLLTLAGIFLAVGAVVVAIANPIVFLIGVIAIAVASLLESLGVINVGVNDALKGIWDSFTIFGKTLKNWMTWLKHVLVVGFLSALDAVAGLWQMQFGFMFGILETFVNKVAGILQKLGLISSETMQIVQQAASDTTDIMMSPLDKIREKTSGLLSAAADKMVDWEMSLPEKNKDKKSLSDVFKGLLDPLKDLLGRKFTPASISMAGMAGEEEPRRRRSLTLDRGGVSGFFGGARAAEQMGGAGNVERQQLNEQKQMRNLLQQINENTKKQQAVYA